MLSHRQNEQTRPQSSNKATQRLEAFSDGVFAIAITLLALDLHVPELSSANPQELVAELAAMWPTYISILLSFVTLLIAWVYHHRLLEGAKEAGTELLFANGLLLLVVSTLPFPTALLGAYLATPAASVVAAIYAGYLAALNLAYNLLWWVVIQPQRRENLKNWRPPRSMLLGLLGFPCYVVAAVVAFWSPSATLVICGALWIVWIITPPSS
jgi:uncharacterized membrane protein